jgi:hypothetical protein
MGCDLVPFADPLGEHRDPVGPVGVVWRNSVKRLLRHRHRLVQVSRARVRRRGVVESREPRRRREGRPVGMRGQLGPGKQGGARVGVGGGVELVEQTPDLTVGHAMPGRRSGRRCRASASSIARPCSTAITARSRCPARTWANPAAAGRPWASASQLSLSARSC